MRYYVFAAMVCMACFSFSCNGDTKAISRWKGKAGRTERKAASHSSDLLITTDARSQNFDAGGMSTSDLAKLSSTFNDRLFWTAILTALSQEIDSNVAVRKFNFNNGVLTLNGIFEVKRRIPEGDMVNQFLQRLRANPVIGRNFPEIRCGAKNRQKYMETEILEFLIECYSRDSAALGYKAANGVKMRADGSKSNQKLMNDEFTDQHLRPFREILDNSLTSAKKFSMDELNSIQREIEMLRDQNQMKLIKLSDSNKFTEAGMIETTYSIELQGTFRQMGQFISELEAQNHIIKIQYLDVSPAQVAEKNQASNATGPNIYRITMEVSIFKVIKVPVQSGMANAPSDSDTRRMILSIEESILERQNTAFSVTHDPLGQGNTIKDRFELFKEYERKLFQPIGTYIDEDTGKRLVKVEYQDKIYTGGVGDVIEGRRITWINEQNVGIYYGGPQTLSIKPRPEMPDFSQEDLIKQNTDQNY